MSNKIIWGIFLAISAILTGYILFFAKLQPAGDIVEYYGITESVINHGSLELTPKDQENLSQSLHAQYFNNPGYYIKGQSGKRYPVHFVFYSLLAVPVRLALRFLGLAEIKTLSFTNLILFSGVLFIIMRSFLRTAVQKLAFLILVYLSPLLFFLTWPGPDLFYLSLLLLASYCFFQDRYLLTAILISLASWHSQPLMVIAVASIATFFIKERKIWKRSLVISFVLVGLMLMPYFYNYLAFGVLTPWTILEDGWTKLYGFGLHNASLRRLFEQLFDLNIGLFWYAPVLVVSGFYSMVKNAKKDKRTLLVILTLLMTAIFYQTNPAWHYGTVGFGPTRHVVYLIPFLIFFMVKNFKFDFTHLDVLALFIITQLFILSENGFIEPNFQNSLHHSPVAAYVLDNFPNWYNPTPEIFVDRTNHTDLSWPTSAIYKKASGCTKAYVLNSEMGKLIQECGYLPADLAQPTSKKEGIYVNYR